MKNKTNWKKELPTLRKYIEEDKMTYEEVANIYGLERSTIEDACKRYNVQYSYKATKPWTEEEIRIVKQGLNDGKTYQEIAESLEGRTKNGVKNFYQTYKTDLNLINPNSPTLHVTREKEIEVVDLLLKGYTFPEIISKTKLKYDSIKKIKIRNKIIPPSKEELMYLGIFYSSKGKRIETGLTKNIFLKHLNDDKMTVSEIARKYNLSLGVVQNYSNKLGWYDKKLANAKKIKENLIFRITGKKASKEDLKKAFVDIFTKEFILDLLERNNYCISKCSKELGGIDSKCIVEAIKIFKIEIPEELDKIRKFSKSLESRRINTKEKFHEFFKEYYPDYEIVVGYSGYTFPMKIRCKKHPEELISVYPYTIKSHIKFDKSGKFISALTLCNKCREEEKYIKRLTRIKEKINFLFPGEFDVSNMSADNDTLYNIKCLKCGETFNAYLYNFLKVGRCINCESLSSGEKLTKQVLKRLKLVFNHQDLKLGIVPKEVRSKVLIDFTLEYKNEPIWIEYNGEQHYNPNVKFSSEENIDSFKDRVTRDMWVKKYCKENNILFIEIPYTFDTLQKIQDLLQRVIIGGEDINSLIDYTPLYEEINKLGITID